MPDAGGETLLKFCLDRSGPLEMQLCKVTELISPLEKCDRMKVVASINIFLYACPLNVRWNQIHVL